jgi:DNA-binding transcriptional ArsR family regulator
MDRVFHALGDATRRAILARVGRGAQTVGQIATPFDMSLAAVSKHIQVLEDAGLVRKTRMGKSTVCTVVVRPLEEADAVIRSLAVHWERRLDELEGFLKPTAGGGEDG